MLPAVTMPRDYDGNPDRYRLGMRLAGQYLDPAVTPLYSRIWELLPDRPDLLIADVGCAEGALAAARPPGRPGRLVGIDLSAVMLARHPAPAVRADAARLPLADRSVSAAVAVNMLYHLPDPLLAIREAARVLRPGGTFIAATISRHDSPELASAWRPAPGTFDAEDAAAMAAGVFRSVAAEYWDGPLVTLPDQPAVRDYLIARQVSPADAAAAAGRFRTPLPVTKRGVLLACRN
jgi:SAM-dependent methyltransferase